MPTASPEQAAGAAAREARRAIRARRKEQVSAGVAEHVGKLKEKLHVA